MVLCIERGLGDAALKGEMDVGSAADEAHRGHAEAVGGKGLLRRLPECADLAPRCGDGAPCSDEFSNADLLADDAANEPSPKFNRNVQLLDNQ